MPKKSILLKKSMVALFGLFFALALIAPPKAHAAVAVGIGVGPVYVGVGHAYGPYVAPAPYYVAPAPYAAPAPYVAYGPGYVYPPYVYPAPVVVGRGYGYRSYGRYGYGWRR